MLIPLKSFIKMFKKYLICLEITFLICLSGINSLDEDEFYHPKLESVSEFVNKNELKANYWMEKAQNILKEKISEKLNENNAKNLILFIGDGMSSQTIVGTRAFLNDTSYRLSFEKFPHFGLSKTYCVDSQVAECACSATAILTGVKSNMNTIGLNGNVKYNACDGTNFKKNHVESIIKWAQEAKKSTGIITTAKITHPTSAAAYAHVSNKAWESDADIESFGCSPNKYEDIAYQLIHSDVGKKLNVILGGGRSKFLSKTLIDEEGVSGNRNDGRNLIVEWLEDRKKRGNAKYVWNRRQLLELDISKTNYLLGLLNPTDCPYNGDRKREGLEKSDPSLSEMVKVAVKLLQKESNGFVLIVVAAGINTAHQESKARKAIEETEEFSKAIEITNSLITNKETLLVVSADHSQVMTTNGYPRRGSNILGLSGNHDYYRKDFSIFSYANGPGYHNFYTEKNKGHRDVKYDNFQDAEYQYSSGVPKESASSGGEDVGVFVSGPKSYMFVGNYEQTNIPMIMAYAANIGPFKK